jgi:hypothetical protein
MSGETLSENPQKFASLTSKPGHSESMTETNPDDSADFFGLEQQKGDYSDLEQDDYSDDSESHFDSSENEPEINPEEIDRTVAEIECLFRQGRENQRAETSILLGIILEQSRTVRFRLLRLMGAAKEPKADKSRRETLKLEEVLGIEDAAGRMLEALLFIDPPFLRTLALCGDEHPEEAFGIKAWQSWLRARAEAKKTEKLDTEAVIRLHTLIAAGLGESVAGKIRQQAVIGGDYLNLGTPIHLNQEGLDALAKNQLVRFRMIDGKEDEGLLVYPTITDPKSLDSCLAFLSADPQVKEEAVKSDESLIRALLQEILSWYETAEKQLAEYEYGRLRADYQDLVVEIAVALQRYIVSIHPFRDGNGRLSHLLMNYVLEKHGLYPSILEFGEDDLFYNSKEWTDQVNQGIHEYKAIKEADAKREEAERGIAECLFPDNYIQYYQQFYNQFEGIVPLKREGLKHKPYREFLDTFIKVAQDFEAWSEEGSEEGSEEESEVFGKWRRFGGLISLREIEAGYDTTPEGQRRIGNLYDEQVAIYRGGACSGVKDPHDFLEMFTGPTAFNTSYRPLLEEGLSPISLQRPTLVRIKQAVRDYNVSLITDYVIQGSRPNLDLDRRNREEGTVFQTILPPEVADKYLVSKQATDHLRREEEIWKLVKRLGFAETEEEEKQAFKTLAKGSYTALLLNRHSIGRSRAWTSPMVSASFDESVARGFQNFVGNSEYTVVVTAKIPKSGAIYVPRIKYIRAFRVGTYDWMGGGDWIGGGEREVLLAGGISPNSIIKVEVKKNGYDFVTLERVFNNEIIYTDINTGLKEAFFFGQDGKLYPKED